MLFYLCWVDISNCCLSLILYWHSYKNRVQISTPRTAWTIFINLKQWIVTRYYKFTVQNTLEASLKFSENIYSTFLSSQLIYVAIVNNKCKSNDNLTRAVAFLTHLGRVKHICVSKLIIIGSDNGLSTGRRQAIIWTSAGVLLIGPLGRNFTEIEIYSFSFWRNWSGLYINQLTIIIYPVYWWWACNGFALYHDKKSHGLCLGNNSSHPGQNHWHLTDDISRCIVVIEKFCILIKKNHWSLFLRVQSTITQQCFRLWLCAKWATRHYLCWHFLLMHICGTRGRWVNKCNAVRESYMASATLYVLW